jgi:hypothetical protein
MKNELKALLDDLDQDETTTPEEIHKAMRDLVHILIKGLDETDRIIEEFKIRATQRDER